MAAKIWGESFTAAWANYLDARKLAGVVFLGYSYTGWNRAQPFKVGYVPSRPPRTQASRRGLFGVIAIPPLFIQREVEAAEHPAVLFVFDLLADEAEDLASQPLSARRERLERFAEQYLAGEKGAMRLSPATTDIEVARKWLQLARGSTDGNRAKRAGLPDPAGPHKGHPKGEG